MYCPSLVSFVFLSKTQWDKIGSRFQQRVVTIERQVARNREIKAETTLHDLIILAQNGTAVAKSFLSLIDGLFKDMLNVVPKQYHSKIRQAARNLVSDFDSQRSGYLNPIGELLSLLSLLKNSSYKLRAIEFRLPNGKTADYCLANPVGFEILIEVTNIHFQPGKIRDKSDLIVFLSGRIEDKLTDKTKGLDLSQLGREFTLLPVVWCDFEDIHTFSSAFETVEAKYQTLPFCIIGQTPMSDGTYTHRFSTVKNLIEAYHRTIGYGSGNPTTNINDAHLFEIPDAKN
jgi:hypothetical protein